MDNKFENNMVTVSYFAPTLVNKKKTTMVKTCPMCGNIPNLKLRKSKSLYHSGYTGKIECGCGMKTATRQSEDKMKLVEKLVSIWNMDPQKYDEGFQQFLKEMQEKKVMREILGYDPD